MKNGLKFAVLFAFFLVLTPGVLAAQVAYYNFESDFTDQWNGNDGTATSVTRESGDVPTFNISGTGGSYSAFYNADSDVIDLTDDTIGQEYTEFTINAWVKHDTLGAGVQDLFDFDDTGGDRATVLSWVQSGSLTYTQSWFPTYADDSADISLSTSTWYMFTYVYDGSTVKGYKDGVEVLSVAQTGGFTFTTPSEIVIGNQVTTHNRGLLGNVDEFKMWDVAYNQTIINNLYNYGNTTAPAAPPVSDPYATVKVFDKYDNSTISGLTVYIGTDSNTTNGAGEATIFNQTGLNYTVDGGLHYFNVSGTATENATVNTETYGAFLDLSAYNVEGTNLLSFNVTSPETSNTTSDGSAYLLLPPNTTTAVNVSAADYYLGEYNVTTGSRDTSSSNLTGLYQTIITFNATNAYSNVTLSNFTGWLYNNDTTYNQTFNTTGNTSTVYGLLSNYTAYLDVFGYSISANNYKYGLFDEILETLTFSLYSENSIFVNIFNEETAARVYDNVTVTVSGNSTEDIYYTTTSSLFLENLTDGNYSLKFNADNFTQRTYEVTVADRASQTVNAYLSPGTDTVTFNIIDYDSSTDIEGASVLQQRLINSTWTTVESKSTDITGRAQFSYTIGVKYRFTIDATGYDQKVFELDPVIFTSYVIRLEKDLAVNDDLGLFDVNIVYYPKYFYDEENNSFTITISSVGGSLESYGYTLAYPGGSLSGTGTNANGETFTNASFLITGANYGDFANLSYWYDSTLGDNSTFNYELLIQNAANNNTAANLKTEDYGLGTLEKILIAIAVTLLFAGVLTLFSNAIAGLAGGALIMGYFTYIDFISVWVVLPSLVVAVIILMRRSSE